MLRLCALSCDAENCDLNDTKDRTLSPECARNTPWYIAAQCSLKGAILHQMIHDEHQSLLRLRICSDQLEKLIATAHGETIVLTEARFAPTPHSY